jgi:hypothetical protein
MRIIRCLCFLIILGTEQVVWQGICEDVPVVESRGKTGSTLATKPVEWPRYVLHAKNTWQLNSPGNTRFDASGLLIRPNGQMISVNDRGSDLFEIRFSPGRDSADLVHLTNLFPKSEMLKLSPDNRLDCEGIAQDDSGRIYICEEGKRWILRCDPAHGKVDRLDIDWTPVKKYFSLFDNNASFEGIAIGGGRLYVANERQMGRIIIVDLATNKVLDDFIARPSTGKVGDIHYSDLSWFAGHLYALLRHHRAVLKIDPLTHAVLAEFQFREMEDAPEFVYHRLYPTGTMEGLAVDANSIWLATDNNGKGRVKAPNDIRPTLFQCDRPDR